MKSISKQLLLLFFITISMLSCRTEDMEIITPPEEEVLGINSTVTALIKNTVTNDGSFDNIIDGASCFDIQLPYTVVANGIEVVIQDEDDIEIVEDIFDEFPDDVDTLDITFPITIIKDDYSTMVINSQGELNAAALLCGTSGSDDDIECIDFQYPITANIFNQNNEQIDTIVFTNDEDLFEFIDDIDEDIIVVFVFPITVILYDGSTQTVANFEELATVIQDNADQCDEDDDNDPNDDDCDTCTVAELTQVLTDCSPWTVDKLERNDEDLESQYAGYNFTFTATTISVDNNGTVFNGTWQASGTANAITVTIDVPGLPDFNDEWTLHEIEQQPNESKIDLRKGDDRLRFESNCDSSGGGPNDADLIAALTTGDWYVNYFFDDQDETADFADYVFNYATDNTATATNTSTTTNGTWATGVGDETELALILNFGTGIPLDELADDWDVLEVTQDIIRLKDISGGNGSIDFLTFGREPYSGGGGGTDLETILSDGTWKVGLYLDDGDDETIDFVGYEITFDASGAVTAVSTSNTNNGTWQVLSNGNKLLLDFGTALPFEEFNDDWDVLMVSSTMVELQDVSGGNGGTDTLLFEKL